MSNTTSLSYDFSALSDEDIQLLYDIIRLAEDTDLPPFRALFTAYERILRDYGIDKDHDQIYFRFLLRLGETKGESLFDRFEALLQKLGFEIRFDAEQNQTAKGKQVNSHPTRSNGSGADKQQTYTPNRRASFDSAYDTRDDSRRAGPGPAIISPPRSQSIDVVQERQNQKPRARKHEVQPAPRHQDHVPDAIPARGRLRQRGTVRQQSGHQPRKVSISKSREHQPRLARQNVRHEYVSEESDGFVSDVETIDQPQYVQPPAPQPASATEGLDLAQMDSYAKELRYRHIAAQAVNLFHRWRRQAVASHNLHLQIYQVAANHDAQILLRQSFDHWHDLLLQRKQERDTELFFHTLNVRAGKARDYFLLTKAFTHWAAAAAEQVVRTNAARRHILRTRYFNAWRNVTLEREEKVRSFRLAKVMKVWKRKTAQVLYNHREAEYVKESTSLSKHYRHWFWHFCERRAPIWYASKQKSALFGKWLDASRQAQLRNSWALDFRDLELVRSATMRWSGRSTVVLENHEKAELFRRRMLIEPNVEALRTEMTLSPLLTRMVRVVDARVAKDALSIWLDKTRSAAQADRLCNLRMMRNAWTMWNDNLRCQALGRTMDDRITTEALYKWVLAERAKLFQRVQDERLKTRMLGSWSAKMNNLCSSLGQARHLLRQARDRRLLQSSMFSWSARAQDQAVMNVRAEALVRIKHLRESLALWTTKEERIRHIDGWAKDARFFVLTSRTLKGWRESAVTHQRSKRRDAYSVVRRKVKVGLARKIFHKWQSRTADHAPLHERAEQLAFERVLLIVPEIMHTWHDRTLLVQQSNNTAASFREHTAVSISVRALSDRLAYITTLSARGEDFHNATIGDNAASALRKLNWACFQLRRQDETATSLADRNRRKHYKNMLKYWRESVDKRRKPVGRLLFQSVVGSGSTSGAANPEAMKFDEDLIEFSTLTPAQPTPMTATAPFGSRGGSAFRSNTAPPLPSSARAPQQARALTAGPPAPSVTATPGYLRTPSRRSAMRSVQAGTHDREDGRSQLQQPRRSEKAPPALMAQVATPIAPEPSTMSVASTTPAGFPPMQNIDAAIPALRSAAVTPFANRLRGLSLSAGLAASRGTGLSQAMASRPSRFAASRFSTVSDVDEVDEEEDMQAGIYDENDTIARSPSRRSRGLIKTDGRIDGSENVE